MKKEPSVFTGLALSGFCMQISILLQSAVPLYEGLQVMAEDSEVPQQQAVLSSISEKLRVGTPFSQAIAESGGFPPYVLHMVSLGERTGSLDKTMGSLSDYYEKEYYLAENLRKAITYPAMMVLMLLAILFVLFTKVMPVFSGVYEQLGTAIPPAAAAAIHLGGILSGAALVLAFLLLIVSAIIWLTGKSGRSSSVLLSALEAIKSHSHIAQAAANRRFCSVMAATIGCGLDITEGLKMAAELVDSPPVREKVLTCEKSLSTGKSFYESVKEAGIFSGFELQLVRVGSRAGKLEHIMGELANEYDKKASESIERIISRLEPTIVSVLAVAVGLVLLSVMLPLAGVLSSIG